MLWPSAHDSLRPRLGDIRQIWVAGQLLTSAPVKHRAVLDLRCWPKTGLCDVYDLEDCEGK
jgi:hypothetical protein